MLHYTKVTEKKIRRTKVHMPDDEFGILEPAFAALFNEDAEYASNQIKYAMPISALPPRCYDEQANKQHSHHHQKVDHNLHLIST